MWTPPKWAYTTFAILFVFHLLDYLDRWALSGVASRLKEDLQIGDADFGKLNTWFLVTLSIVSPMVGWLGDRYRRTWLLALGVGIWSLATVGTGLARSYEDLRHARALLGIGEGTYGVLAPTLLTDLFRRETRSRVLSLFYVAMPLGYALGVAGGGQISEHSPAWFAGTALAPWAGWRMAFFLVGLPGLLATFAILFVPEPHRGASEGVSEDRLVAHEQARPTAEDYKDLAVNSSYTYVVFGQAAFTFAFGGLAYWLPLYLERVKGYSHTQATMMVALCGLVAPIVGMTMGGVVTDLLAKKNPRALFLVPGFSMLLSVPFTLVAIFSNQTGILLASMFLAMTMMLVNTGPCSAIIANVVSPNMRGVAYSVSILLIHFLGDLWSPWLMGIVSDYTGHAETAATFLGRWLSRIGAHPVDGQNLTAGMLVVIPAILLGAFVLLAGARHLPREMALMLAKLKAAPKV